MDYLLLHYENQSKDLLKGIKYFFLFDKTLILIGLPMLMIWKVKKIMTIKYYREQRIIILGRQDFVLASKDQEEINLYNY